MRSFEKRTSQLQSWETKSQTSDTTKKQFQTLLLLLVVVVAFVVPSPLTFIINLSKTGNSGLHFRTNAMIFGNVIMIRNLKTVANFISVADSWFPTVYS